MLKFHKFLLGPWRAVAVLGVTQILAWGTMFYTPVLMLPRLAADRGFTATFAMAGFSAGLLVARFLSPHVGVLIDGYAGAPSGWARPPPAAGRRRGGAERAGPGPGVAGRPPPVSRPTARLCVPARAGSALDPSSPGGPPPPRRAFFPRRAFDPATAVMIGALFGPSQVAA